MPKLWEKGYTLDPLIERFTVGKDYLTDMKLIRYDVIASIAHAEMLAKVGYLSNEELEKLKIALKKLSDLIDSNQFSISPDEEDCHTAIENFLVREVGEIGKKIHMARSRNDQVLTALRLLYKDELKKIEKLIQELKKQLLQFSKRFGRIKFAGFTHTRKAMPTNFRTWCMALYDALNDDLKILKPVFELIDQSPLGTGAGYGVPAKIDRRFTAQRLGFKKIQKKSHPHSAEPRKIRISPFTFSQPDQFRSEQVRQRHHLLLSTGNWLSVLAQRAVHRELDHATQAQSRSFGTGEGVPQQDRRQADGVRDDHEQPHHGISQRSSAAQRDRSGIFRDRGKSLARDETDLREVGSERAKMPSEFDQRSLGNSESVRTGRARNTLQKRLQDRCGRTGE